MTPTSASSVACPLTGDPAQFVAHIPVADIVGKYRGLPLPIDVEAYFEGLAGVDVWASPRTGYRFYTPPHLEGRPELYAQLGAIDWYYAEDKWDHGPALRDLDGARTLLEIGCGHGAFLAKAKALGVDVLGTESSDAARRHCGARGLEATDERLDAIRSRRPDGFDVVMAFQVLEHIADPLPFLRDAVALVRPGGRLTVTVPNNDSLWAAGSNALNMPPHHLGLWNLRSLLWLQQAFPIRAVDVRFEPLTGAIKPSDLVADEIARHPSKLRRTIWASRVVARVAGPWRRALSTVTDAAPGHSLQIAFERVA